DGDNLYAENRGQGSNSYLEIVRGGQTTTEPQVEGQVEYAANFSCVMDRPVTDQLCYQECRITVDPRSETGAFYGHASCEEMCTPDPKCEVAVPVGLAVS